MPGDFIKKDLAAFFNSNELGDIASWQGNTFNCMFFNEYEAVNIFGIEVESEKPMLLARDEDIEGIAQGAKIEILNSGVITEFKVINIQPDGTGLTILILSKD